MCSQVLFRRVQLLGYVEHIDKTGAVFLAPASPRPAFCQATYHLTPQMLLYAEEYISILGPCTGGAGGRAAPGQPGAADGRGRGGRRAGAHHAQGRRLRSAHGVQAAAALASCVRAPARRLQVSTHCAFMYDWRTKARKGDNGALKLAQMRVARGCCSGTLSLCVLAVAPPGLQVRS